MIINIVAGGPEEYMPNLLDYDGENVIWAGADRGVLHLLKRNIKPANAFGDFDSVTEEEFKFIENEVADLKRYKPEKDETDMELALNWAIDQKPEMICLFGATGGRLDHFYANVHLLLPPTMKGISVEIRMIDRHNHLYIKSAGKHYITKRQEQKYVSFIPLNTDVPDLTLEGFKYPLTNRHISLGSTLCISNELINDVGTFSFSEGILLVIRSRD